jgi:hypothetical protein
MTDSDMKLLLFIPMSLALVFMFWVLWRLEKQIRRGKDCTRAIAPSFNEADRQPAGSRYQAARSSDTAFKPQQIERSLRSTLKYEDRESGSQVYPFRPRF